MEVLHGESDERTVLVAVGGSAEADAFCRRLADSYRLVRCKDAADVLETLNNRFNTLSAAVVDVRLAHADECALLRAIHEERAFDTIPVIVAAERIEDPRCAECLDAGAIDAVGLSCPERVLAQRVDNAVRLMRSSTFFEIERMLRELPSMIFLKDAQGRYVFSTQYWHHLDTGGDPKWTIRGKTDVDIRKDRENALLAMEADKEILRTGKGTQYVIEINADGVQDFIELIKRPVFDEHGNVAGIIALGNNVTESELLKRELAQRALADELTGIGNRRAYAEFVEGIPARSDFPLAVISADCDNLKTVNDTLGHLVGDEYIRMAAVVTKAALPEGGHVFRTGGDEFVAFVPRTTEQQAQVLVESMRRKAELFKLSAGEAHVSYGVAAIEGPGASIQAAVELADQRMYADKAAYKNR